MVGAPYFRLSGTSMAAPMVSGAAALQKDPTQTPDKVKARLMKTAGQTHTSQYAIFTFGAGYLDIVAPWNDATVITGTALSPGVSTMLRRTPSRWSWETGWFGAPASSGAQERQAARAQRSS